MPTRSLRGKFSAVQFVAHRTFCRTDHNMLVTNMCAHGAKRSELMVFYLRLFGQKVKHQQYIFRLKKIHSLC